MFIFQDGRVLVREGSIDIQRPEAGVLTCSLDLPANWRDIPAWCVVDGGFQLPEGSEFIGLRQVWHVFGAEAFARAGGAWQTANWLKDTRFCSRCGAGGLKPNENDHGLSCPSCGLAFYPTISPAIIVAVTREVDGMEKLLLAHNNGMPGNRFSVLAGFVEPGETLEETVAREVREEVSVSVRDIRYFASQPWPFPHSLMLGFTARWDGGELRPDGVEIGTAGWFSPEEIEDMDIPDPASISRRLIDGFLFRRLLH